MSPETLVDRQRLCASPSLRCESPEAGRSGSASPDPAAAEAARMEEERLRRARTACQRQWGNLLSMVERCERAERRTGDPEAGTATSDPSPE